MSDVIAEIESALADAEAEVAWLVQQRDAGDMPLFGSSLLIAARDEVRALRRVLGRARGDQF